MDHETEVPQYFVCPISLQIMKDPVTVITGITYDRESIEQWLFSCNSTICPVTKQPLPLHSELTPNHTLRRLIQVWCTENALKGVDRVSTPKQPLEKTQVHKLLNDLKHPQFQLKILRKLEFLAAEKESNKECLADAGVAKAVLFLIVRCHDTGQFCGLEEAFNVVYLIPISSDEMTTLSRQEYDRILESLTWFLGFEVDGGHNQVPMNTRVMIVLKKTVEAASSQILEIMRVKLFKKIMGYLRQEITSQGVHAALHVMLKACALARNRTLMVEAGAVFELIEIELGTPEKRTTELCFGILSNLCCCAEGRAELLSHCGGLAVVANRILKVSPAVDEHALRILNLVSKCSGKYAVSKEMLRVGAVPKFCMLLQANCAANLKEKAMDILRCHFDEWKRSPCINLSTLEIYTWGNYMQL